MVTTGAKGSRSGLVLLNILRPSLVADEVVAPVARCQASGREAPMGASTTRRMGAMVSAEKAPATAAPAAPAATLASASVGREVEAMQEPMRTSLIS